MNRNRVQPSIDPRARLRKLAREYSSQGDALGWFERLYADAQGDASVIPWANLQPNPNLTDWFRWQRSVKRGARTLVVGCGLGDDAEFLAAHGLRVTAFDLSPSAIAW